MSVVGGVPPFSWSYGTDLANDFQRSVILCEAMQALKNRADLVGVSISDWSAYDYAGNVIQNLGQTPADADLSTYGAFRHTNHIADLRTALEAVLGSYYNGDGDPWTLATLMTAAEGRAGYNKSIAALGIALGYDGEDVEELLKAVDLLVYSQKTEITADFPIDKDAYTYSDTPDTNYGSDLYVWVAGPTVPPPEVAQGYFAATTAPLVQYIISATLHFYVNTNLGSGETMAVRPLREGEEWEEGSITYNTAPTHDAVIHTKIPIYPVGWDTIDVSGANIQQGFVLCDYPLSVGYPWIRIASRETSYSPSRKPFVRITYWALS